MASGVDYLSPTPIDSVILSDRTISSLQTIKKIKSLIIGPLRTPVTFSSNQLRGLKELTILNGTEIFNIFRVLPSCFTVKKLVLGELNESDTKIILCLTGGVVKTTVWNNLTNLQLNYGKFAVSHAKTMKILADKKFFPSLLIFAFNGGNPIPTRLNAFHALYTNVYRFIAKHGKTLRQLTVNFNFNHEALFDYWTLWTFQTTEASNALNPELKSYKQMISCLSSLNLDKLDMFFCSVECSSYYGHSQWNLGSIILANVYKVSEASLNWSGTSSWFTYEKDLQQFLHNNCVSLNKLDIRLGMLATDFGCSNLARCKRLIDLNIEAVWCKLNDIQQLPVSIKKLQLLMRLKPAQWTWITSNMTYLEELTLEQTSDYFDGEQLPIVPLFRISKLTSLTVKYCSNEKIEQLASFCLNHPGIKFEFNDTYFYASQDSHFTINRLKYRHCSEFEKEECLSTNKNDL